MSSRRSDERALPFAVFGVFVLLTLLVTSYVWRTTRAADRARFDNAVETTRDAIAARLETYVNVLIATRAMLVVDPATTRDKLAGYIRTLDVQRRYPGIQGIGFSVRVSADDVPRLVEDMRRSGFTEFRVWPEHPRDVIHTIVLLEPLDRRNRAAMGFDMFTRPGRREAMIRARDTGRPAASAPVTLVQEIDERKQPGFLIYAPVYSTGAIPETVDERRETLVGFIYAPFRVHDLLEGVFGSQERPEIGFEIYDGNEQIFATRGISPRPRFVENDAIGVAGRTWRIRWISRREGGGGALMLAGGTFLGGIVIASLLFLLMRVQLRAREEAERTAERLRASEASLQRANQAKDDFLATLSHELRTPMTSIMGWSQMLEEGVDEETEETAIDAIRKSARVQAQLIDDLLDVSRVTAGKMRIEPRPLELEPVIAAAVDTVAAAAETQGVRLSADLAPRVCVEADAPRLQQVVWNLMSNAVKFTPAGGEVRVTLREEEGDAIIEVRDTGPGVDPEFMPHLFERFRQADSSTTRAHMGLGLGLSIVHHLVELHGGTIAAENNPEGGATFRVRLPLLRGATAAGEERETEELPGDALEGVRLLVVDDDEEVRSYVTAAFRAAGADVRAAESVDSATAVLAEWPADIVLTDLAMPRADGFELLEKIRASDVERIRTLPVVALTAFAMPEDRQRVADAGFDGFVAKPVDPADLRATVARACAAARAV